MLTEKRKYKDALWSAVTLSTTSNVWHRVWKGVQDRCVSPAPTPVAQILYDTLNGK